MRGRWSTFGTRRQDAAALGSTRGGSGTSAINCRSNIEVDNEDIIARCENDMNRFGLRPSSPNISGANPATSRPPLPTKRTSTTDLVIPFKTTVNSIQLEEKNRRKSKSLDSQKADQLVLKNLSKSFDSIQKSFDSMLDKYHLKDTLPEEQFEKASISTLCLGIMHTFGCGDHPVFRNCAHNFLVAKNTDESVTKEMIDDTIEASTIESNMHHARLNIPNKQRDVEYKSANATDEKQQHASFTNNSIYERDVHQTQQSNATIQVSRERRNDDPLQPTRDGTDVLLDELRQSPV